jgi:hypothetical protein
VLGGRKRGKRERRQDRILSFTHLGAKKNEGEERINLRVDDGACVVMKQPHVGTDRGESRDDLSAARKSIKL